MTKSSWFFILSTSSARMLIFSSVEAEEKDEPKPASSLAKEFEKGTINSAKNTKTRTLSFLKSTITSSLIDNMDVAHPQCPYTIHN